MGISFEQAIIEKKAIALQKTKKDMQWLKDHGIIPASNALKRRKQIEEYMKNDYV